MSRLIPLPFQEAHSEALLARFRSLQGQYERLGANPAPEALAELREQAACVLLQAPTGIGKTLIACETMNRFSQHEKILWFWCYVLQYLRRNAFRFPALVQDF